MNGHSLDEILASFKPDSSPDSKTPIESRCALTVWIPAEYKGAYDDLQKKSSRRFSKKIRELILAAIDKAGHSAFA